MDTLDLMTKYDHEEAYWVEHWFDSASHFNMTLVQWMREHWDEETACFEMCTPTEG